MWGGIWGTMFGMEEGCVIQNGGVPGVLSELPAQGSHQSPMIGAGALGGIRMAVGAAGYGCGWLWSLGFPT